MNYVFIFNSVILFHSNTNTFNYKNDKMNLFLSTKCKFNGNYLVLINNYDCKDVSIYLTTILLSVLCTYLNLHVCNFRQYIRMKIELSKSFLIIQ